MQLGFSSASWVCCVFVTFIKFEKGLATIYFFKYFFSFSLPLAIISGLLIKCILVCLLVSHRSLRCYSFPLFLFFFSSSSLFFFSFSFYPFDPSSLSLLCQVLILFLCQISISQIMDYKFVSGLGFIFLRS